MYKTCLSCYDDLGSNDALTWLPVGRLVAFDTRRGRLWVVCPACRSWNLVPLEERWEAVEEASERFSTTRRRANSDEISLAFLAGGVGLIRIGQATLPEFAAWRYGPELFGRWRRFRRGADAEIRALGIGTGASLAVAGAAVALSAGALAVAGAALLGVPAGLYGWSQLAQRRSERPLCWTFADDGSPRTVSVMGGATAELIPLPDRTSGWTVSLIDFDGRKRFEGDTAWRVLAAVLSHHNRFGGSKRSIEAAVGHIEEAGESHAFLDRMARGGNVPVARLPQVIRLGIEISLHETSERRALDGHLMDLERQWRDAETVAQIADNLLLPATVSQQLHRMRNVNSRGA